MSSSGSQGSHKNVLIDRKNDAWLTDFGPGYTEGWVDKSKVGTVEGDIQGLAKRLWTFSAECPSQFVTDDGGNLVLC